MRFLPVTSLGALLLLLAATSNAQISYPQLGDPTAAAAAPQSAPPAAPPGGVFKFLTDLGPQMESAKMLSSLFSQPAASPQQQPGQQQQAAGMSPVQLMGQLGELIKSTQERTAKAMSSSQETAQAAVQSAGQQTMAASQGAQTGVQSALSELGANIQRLATNNPNLLPDLKNLYQSVSSKLVPSAAAAPTGQQQFADNVAKMAGTQA